MENLTEIRQCLGRRRRNFSVGSPLVIDGVRALSHTCYPKLCIFYGALCFRVYGCICARSAPQARIQIPPIGLIGPTSSVRQCTGDVSCASLSPCSPSASMSVRLLSVDWAARVCGSHRSVQKPRPRRLKLWFVSACPPPPHLHPPAPPPPSPHPTWNDQKVCNTHNMIISGNRMRTPTRSLCCCKKLSITAAVPILPELELETDVWDEGFVGGEGGWAFETAVAEVIQEHDR